jgi:hypothetical protein
VRCPTTGKSKIENIDPAVSLIIRGHSLLEEQLDLYLEKKLENPEYVRGFGFRSKVQLARALSKQGKTEEIWKLVSLLTDIRNQSRTQAA